MNPAVQKLFEDVENPILVQAALQALRLQEPIDADYLPAPLVEPFFILHTAAIEMKGREIVLNPNVLRDRVSGGDVEVSPHHQLTWALLDGAGFNSEPRKYPDIAKMNCEPGEVRLQYLQDGQRFKMGNRQGQLLYRTPSRAVITLSGGPTQKTFKTHQKGGIEGEDVTITSSGIVSRGCSLDAPVTPIH